MIHLFLNGGPSHVDTFDHKPALDKYHGQQLPKSLHLVTERRTGTVFRSPFKFERYGQSGIEVSEIFPKIGECIDDIAVIRSMQADVPNHIPSILLMNCGDSRLIRPSLGSWVTYGLGSENQNLPGFVALRPGGYPGNGGAQNWQAGFLPGATRELMLIPGLRTSKDCLKIPPIHAFPKPTRAGSSNSCGSSMKFTARSATRTRTSRPASSPSSWARACSSKQRKRSTSVANPSRSAECTGQAPRAGQS